MIAHKAKSLSGIIAEAKTIARNYCKLHKIPYIPVVSNDGSMPNEASAAFDPDNRVILFSNTILDWMRKCPDNESKAWLLLNAARHELEHYEQFIRTGKCTGSLKEEEARNTARLWADDKLTKLSANDINPVPYWVYPFVNPNRAKLIAEILSKANRIESQQGHPLPDWIYWNKPEKLKKIKTTELMRIKDTLNFIYRNPLPSSLYKSFHGAPPLGSRRVSLPTPNRLIKIGRLMELVYKPESPSKLAGRYYKHAFGDTGRRMLKEKPVLATDKSGKGLYILPDKSNPKFTKWGIIG